MRRFHAKKEFHVNGNFKNVGGSILIWDKIDTETKTANKRQIGHYIMINGAIPQENIPIVNIYAPTTVPHKYRKQTLTDITGRSWQ